MAVTRFGRGVAAAGLLVVAVVHLELAPLYDSSTAVLSQGILFRGVAVTAAIAAVVILQFAEPAAYLAGAVVAGMTLAAVLTYRWLDLAALGPLPDLYEPQWYTVKLVAVAAAAVAGTATGALLFGHRRHRAVQVSLGVFVLDKLDAEDRAVVEAHLDRCPACRSEDEPHHGHARTTGHRHEHGGRAVARSRDPTRGAGHGVAGEAAVPRTVRRLPVRVVLPRDEVFSTGGPGAPVMRGLRPAVFRAGYLAVWQFTMSRPA
jgi:hypothetical protein